MNNIIDEKYSTTGLLIKDKPLVSIITVVYNGEQFLEETIQSVTNQTYDNVEYVIIDGGSTDGTINIIKKYTSNIDCWISEKDAGIYDAMNKGINLATGEWINFMNAGDLFYNDSVLKNIFSDDSIIDYSVIYSDTMLFSKEKNIRKISYADFSIDRFVHQSIVYKKFLHNIYGYYLVDKKLTISDYIFFVQLTYEKKKKLPDTIALFNIDGISSNQNSFYQKISYDFMCRKIGKLKFLLILILYPIYRFIKYKIL